MGKKERERKQKGSNGNGSAAGASLQDRQLEKQIGKVISAETDDSKRRALRKLVDAAKANAALRHRDQKVALEDIKLEAAAQETFTAILGCIGGWPEALGPRASYIAGQLARESLLKGPVWAMNAILHRLREQLTKAHAQELKDAMKASGKDLHASRTKVIDEQRHLRARINVELDGQPALRAQLIKEATRTIDQQLTARRAELKGQLSSLDTTLAGVVKEAEQNGASMRERLEITHRDVMDDLKAIETRYAEFSAAIESVLEPKVAQPELQPEPHQARRA